MSRALTLALAIALFPLPARAAELGLNVHQSSTVGLDITRDAKLAWVRIDLNWLDAQPQNGAPDFTLFDTIVDGARSRGLKVLAVLAYTPAWASTGDTKGDGSTNDVPITGAYAAFVTAAVQHFAGRVDHYELWNEPNLAQFWEGTTQQYIDLVLVPGADALHAACASCQVVGPALATVGTAYASWMDAIFSQAQAKIDIVSGHIYAGFPAAGSTIGTTSDSFFNKLESHRVVMVGSVPVYTGPLSFHEEMTKYNVQKPFWLTETGLQAALGNTTQESAQTDYYRNVIESMATRPWWTTTIFYEAFDEPNTGLTWGVALDDSAAPSGYQPKPVMQLLQNAASVVPDGGALVDGGITPGSDGGTGSGGAGTDGAATTPDASASPDAGHPSGKLPTSGGSGCAMVAPGNGDRGARPLALGLFALGLLALCVRRRGARG